MKYQFHLTCSACPEQYDVKDGHHIVAYVRYRHGLKDIRQQHSYFGKSCGNISGGYQHLCT